MTKTLRLCPDCAGIGHPDETCECDHELDFLDGCCQTCGGDGELSAEEDEGEDGG